MYLSDDETFWFNNISLSSITSLSWGWQSKIRNFTRTCHYDLPNASGSSSHIHIHYLVILDRYKMHHDSSVDQLLSLATLAFSFALRCNMALTLNVFMFFGLIHCLHLLSSVHPIVLVLLSALLSLKSFPLVFYQSSSSVTVW